MGAKGIALGEQGHVVNLLPPTTAIAGAPYSDYFHLKEAAHATIIIQTGTVTSSSTFIVYESDDSSGTTKTALSAGTYKATATAASDTFTAPAAFTASGLTTGTTDNLTWIIEIDASALTDAYPYLAVNFASTEAIQVSAVAVLSGLRYAEDIQLSAID